MHAIRGRARFVVRSCVLTLLALTLSVANSRGASGTWINLSGGSWTNTANWSGGTIANLTGFTADFSTLNLTADATVTLDGARTIGNLTFGDTTPSHNWFLNTGSAGPLTLAVSSGSPTITINNRTNTVGLVLAGTQGMTKAGAGTLILGGANTYSGNTTVSAGVLQVGSGISGNTLANAFITNNSQLIFFRGDATATTISSPVVGSGTTIFSGTSFLQSGQFTIGATNLITGPIILNRARLNDNGGGQPRFGSPSSITVPVGSAILAQASSVFTNPISISGQGWQETTAPNFLGALRLSGNATWAGPITLTGNARINVHAQSGNVTGPLSGPYEIEFSSTSGSSTLTLGSPANTTAATRIFNFGTALTVVVTNQFALSSGPLTMAGGILQMRGNSFSFANLSSAVASSQVQNGDPVNVSTLTVGTDNSSTTFAGALADGSSAVLNLVKVGSGTLIMTGTSSHGGSTVVSNGVLLVQGATAAFSSLGSVTARSGATFGDSGVINGPITIDAGGTLQAGGLNGVTLACNSPMTFGAVATDLTTTRVNVALGGKVAAGGGLTVNGTNTINIIGSSPAIGVYDLITYSGTIGGSGFGGFVLGTMPAGTVATLQDSGTAVQLNVTASGTEPKVWKGDVAGFWNPGAGNEWFGSLTATAKPYVEFDNVTFDDSATNFTANLTANVTPSSLVISNPTQNLTLTGPGSVGGNVTLVKNGAGMFTINTTNSFSPVPLLNEGTLAVARVADGGVNSPLGTASSVNFNGGTLQVNEVNGSMNRNLNLIGNATIKTDNTLTLSGLISGAGQWIKTGSGTLVLTGLGTPGSTLISSGTLQIGDGSFFLGGLAGNVENHGTLKIYRNDSAAEVNLPGNLTGDGIVYFLGSGIPLQGRYSAVGDNSGFNGTVYINNSRVTASTPARLGGASSITITNNGGIYLNASGLPEYGNPLVISGNGWTEGAPGAPVSYGAVRLQNAVYTGSITMIGNARITAVSSLLPGSFITGSISESGGSWKLEVGQKEGNNNNQTIWLTASNSYTGGTDIRGAVLVSTTPNNLGPGPITLDEGFSTAFTNRLDLFGGITLTNAITLDSIGVTGSRAAIFATNGSTAIISGPITVTAAVGNGGHFGADDASVSTLRITGPISAPTGVAPNIFVGTVEVGGGGSYTNLTHGGGILRLIANNGLSSAAALTAGSTTASTFDLNGFNQTLTGLTKGASTSTITNSAASPATLTLNVPVSTTYAGSLRGNLQVTVGGPGVSVWNGANDYSGPTAVNGGKLLIGGAHSAPGLTTVGSGAILGGSGTMTGPVTVQSGGTLSPSGTISPNPSVGQFAISNSVTFALGSIALMEITRDSGSPLSDSLLGVSTLNYGGTLVVTNVGSGNTSLRSGDIFTLFTATTYNLSFNSFNLPPLLPGLSWNTSSLTVNGKLSITGTPIPPQFGPVGLSGSTLTFSGTGGLNGARYVVLTATNVNQPVITWTPLVTNTFGVGGTFTFGDSATNSIARRFYMIAVP